MQKGSESEEKRAGSFVRWQGITIAQLTFAINVILGFSGAALAFGANLLIREEFQPVGWARCAFVGSLVALLLSIGLGVWCVVNRLRDFRATTQAARKREAGASPEDIEPLRTLYTRLGRRTWVLFWWQIGTFLVGVCLVVASVTIAMWSKLS